MITNPHGTLSISRSLCPTKSCSVTAKLVWDRTFSLETGAVELFWPRWEIRLRAKVSACEAAISGPEKWCPKTLPACERWIF